MQGTANVAPCLIQSFSLAADTLALEPNTIPDFAQQARKAKRPYTSLGNGQTDVQSNNDVAQQLASIQPHVNLWLSAGAYHQKREFKWHEEFDLPVTQASRC